MTSSPIELPDPQTAADNAAAWASTDPGFAQLLGSEVKPAKALGRWSARLLKQNRIADAIGALRSAAALQPQDALVWTTLGIAHSRLGSAAEAEACFEHSLALAPAQPDIWLLVGTARKNRGDLGGAEAACRQAIAVDAKSALAWQCLGLVKDEQREYAAAIECFQKCIQFSPRRGDAAIPAILGRLYSQTGQFIEACDAFDQASQLDSANPHYLQMHRQMRFLKDLMQGKSVEEATATFEYFPPSRGSSSTDPAQELPQLFNTAFGLLSGFGHTEAAIRLGKKRLDLWPSATAEYLLRALNGDRALAQSPPDYVVEHFDEFAQGFDAKLVGVLGYDIPQKICAAVAALLPAVSPETAATLDVLDAGCGTGLCGPLLRPMARKLAGVDLSSKMIGFAQQKGCYDLLVREEITAFLNNSPDCFDVIVAADLVIYIGDLVPLFAAAAKALRLGGLLALSTEACQGAGYQVLKSGRFAQSREYVLAVASQAFKPCGCVDTTIRLEANQPIAGNIFLFRRS